MKKRGVSVLLAAAVFLGGAFPVRADGTLYTAENLTAVTSAEAASIPAKSAVLLDGVSGKLLFEKDAHQKLPPASITKIMTLLLVMEAIEAGQIAYTDRVACSEHAAGMGGSQIWLEPGEEMTVEELLKAAAVNSANDATTVLAECVGGSESAFVDQMNRKAQELGMKDTTFKNPTGLDAEGHLTTAYDIALMARALIAKEDITRFTTIWMDSLRDGKTALTNTNRLVRFYEGCTGLKTGTTDGAGSCLAATATRNGVSLVAVTMGSATSDERFSACRTLLDYGFSAFESFSPTVDPALLTPVTVKKGTAAQVPLKAAAGEPVLIAKGRGSEVEMQVDIPEEAEAPILKGQQLGTVTFTLDGAVLASIPLTAGWDVSKMYFLSSLGLLLRTLFQFG